MKEDAGMMDVHYTEVREAPEGPDVGSMTLGEWNSTKPCQDKTGSENGKLLFYFL